MATTETFKPTFISMMGVCWGFQRDNVPEEKSGKIMRPWRHIEAFRECMTDCNLTDLGFQGHLFTWCNMREPPKTINARLDRAVATPDWRLRFPHACVTHLLRRGSDHCPLLLQLEPGPNVDRKGPKKFFQFEAMWSRASDCEDVIRKFWSGGDDSCAGERVWQRLQAVRGGLNDWDKTCFGHVDRRIQELEKKLESKSGEPASGANWAEYRRDKKELEELLNPSTRRKTNAISRLRDHNGIWQTSVEGIQTIVLNYFHDIFKSTRPRMKNIEEALGSVHPKVSDSMNNALAQPYTTEEVRIALSQMYPFKSPGPDGMSPIFFQKYWHVVGMDITSCILDFLNHRAMDPKFNYTHIVLIPKRPNPKEVSHFRPISLCNVIYRVASKMITNRLKPFMHELISENQSAFIPDRLITDNVLVAYELNHYLSHKYWDKVGHTALKLDLSKAYDRVEWNFLLRVLEKLGFHPHFITLIRMCVSTVSYSIMLSGRKFGHFKPQRGLRQGDPLSPYLFLFCTEALSHLIRLEEARGNLTGVAVSRHAPRVSHLLFADDTLIFCQATEEAIQCIKNILSLLEAASGLKVSVEKSSIVFSKNTPIAVKEHLANLMGMRLEERHNKYLGLPTTVGRSKREVFQHVKERVWAKLQDWQAKNLSQAGKVTLIKSVIQSIPTFVMSFFRLPTNICGKIETLLAKQFWRIATNPDCLLSKVLKSKYFPETDVFEAQVRPLSSATWRGILETRPVVVGGSRWQVGSSKDIHIWSNRWLPRLDTFRVLTAPHTLPMDTMVAELLEDEGNGWNVELVSSIFIKEDVDCILSIPLPADRGRDVL
ncbi:UNVERIFIED_CONTAM: putative mitochondrial protein, partial [Sesamum latifolium]